jgi:hypothetical protein
MTTTGKNRIMIFGPKTDGTYVVEFRTDARRDAGHIYPKNGGGRGPAFPGTNALRIVRAGCERYLIKEVGRPC